jgi:hypothetical protein
VICPKARSVLSATNLAFNTQERRAPVNGFTVAAAGKNNS